MLSLKKILWERAGNLFLEKGLTIEKVREAARQELEKKYPQQSSRTVSCSFDWKTKTLTLKCSHSYLASQLRLSNLELKKSIEKIAKISIAHLRVISSL
jgi:hypothetical protein